MLYREGRAGSVKEMGSDHSYPGRADQGVSRRWVVTMAIQGGQSSECQGEVWGPLLYREGRAGIIKEMGSDQG